MSQDVLDQQQTGGLIDDVLSTPELHTPPAEPDAHQGEITGVTLENFDGGSSAIKLILHSKDVAELEENYMIFLPKAFVENIFIDPNTLPEEEGNKQKTQYRIAIANDTKDATLQNLRLIAQEQGRTLEGASKPQNIEDFVALFSALLTGVQVVFVRKPDTKAEDPRYRNRLRVRSIYDISVINKLPKSLKAVRKMWEVQQ